MTRNRVLRGTGSRRLRNYSSGARRARARPSCCIDLRSKRPPRRLPRREQNRHRRTLNRHRDARPTTAAWSSAASGPLSPCRTWGGACPSTWGAMWRPKPASRWRIPTPTVQPLVRWHGLGSSPSCGSIRRQDLDLAMTRHPTDCAMRTAPYAPLVSSARAVSVRMSRASASSSRPARKPAGT